MASPLAARDLVRRIRKRIGDENEGYWNDDEILESIDAMYDQAAMLLREEGQDHEVDYIEIDPSSLTNRDGLWWDWKLPWYVDAVRQVEGVDRASMRGTVIGHVPQEFKTRGAGRRMVVWTYSGNGRPGTITLHGRADAFGLLRLWFVRKYPPLHFGTLTNVTAETVEFQPDAGGILQGEAIYEGFDVYIHDFGERARQIGRITAWDQATETATVSFPTQVVNGDVYSLCLPLPDMANEHFVQLVATQVFATSGNTQQGEQAAAYLARLEDIFRRYAGTRTQGEPPRMTHRR